MTLEAERLDPAAKDAVSAVLKWVLLAVAIITFALLAWATRETYRLAPPQPNRFLSADGALLMTNGDIVAGPIGWAQLDAVYEHGLAYARSNAFYNTTLFWQWMRLPGDVLFALGAVLMAWDFIVKLRPLYPQAVDRLVFRRPLPVGQAAE